MPFGSLRSPLPSIDTGGDEEIEVADLPIVFSSGNGNAIVISHPKDTALTSFTISATNATITLSSVLGLSFSVGDGTGDSVMSFSGSITAVNTALNGVSIAGSSLPITVSISATTTGGTNSASIVIDDTIAPTVSSLSPADNATGVALTVNPSITFSENVQFGSGDVLIRRATEIVTITRAADGETTNLTASNGAFTANVSDADGGSDAVRFTANNTSGVATAISVATSGNTAFNNGGNHVRFRVKDVGTGSPWLRVGFINVTRTARVWIKPSTGEQGAIAAAISNFSMVADAGGDGYVVEFDADLEGNDYTGAFQILMASADAASTIVGTGGQAIRIHDLTIGNYDRESFSVTADVGTGDGQISISGATMTFKPSIDLTEDEQFSIYIPQTAVRDMRGNYFAGILDNMTWSFTTTSPDSAAPGILSTFPATGATGVPLASVLTVTFNEGVAFGTGNITLRKYESGSWTDVEAFNVATEVGTSAGQVNIVGSTVSIYPTASLSNNIPYAVRIASTAIDDLFGNSFPGIADDITWTFTAENLALYDFGVTALTGGTEAAISVTYNPNLITDGTFYFVVQPSGADPSATQIRNGQNGGGTTATWSISATYASIDVFTDPANGLTQNTAYEAFAVHRSDAGVDSNVVSFAFDTTNEVPTLTNATDAANGSDAGIIGVTTDDPTGTLYWVVTTSATKPTATQVRAGQDHSGATAADSGSQAISGAGAIAGIAVTGLAGSTTYYAHFHHRDGSNNDSVVVSGDGFTTSAARTTLYSYATAGATTGLSATNGSLAGAQTDSDGGSNAISLTCNSNGANTTVSVATSSQITLFNGVNYISAKVKKGAWASSGARIRFARSNFTSNGSFSVNLNTATVDSPAGAPNQICTDLGDGWMRIEQIIDATGWGDWTGTLTFYMGDAANDQTITAAANHVLYLYQIKVER
jgi:hypothetical protein